MSFEEWSNKKKKEREQSGNVSDQVTSNSKPTTSFSEWSNNKLASNVDQNYINTFITDFNSYLNTLQNQHTSVGYKNASSFYNSTRSALSEFESRYNIVGKWLDINKSHIDEKTYGSVKSFLDGYQNSSSSILKEIENTKNFYSQFKSEDDYNSYVKGVERREGMKTFDLDAGKAEIDDLQAKWDEASRIKGKIDQLKGQAQSYISSRNVTKYNEVMAEVKALEERYNQLGGDTLSQTLADKKLYHHEASNLQALDKLQNDAMGAADFNTYSKIGNAIENPSMDDAEGWLSIGQWKPFAEEIGNVVTYSRENADAIQMNAAEGYHVYGDYRYKYMTDEEVAVYNYYIGKGDKESADKYLSSLESSLTQREAYKIAENVEGKYLAQILVGAAAGLDQFASGIKGIGSFITGNEEITSPSVTQQASSLVREDLADTGFEIFGTSIGQIGYDFVNTSANMLPSILVGSMTGGVGGTIMLGASAGGNAYSEMINLGYDKSQAKSYAALVGASEAGLQYLLGGITSLGGKVSGGLTKAIASKVDNAFARAAITFGGELLSEGVEESLQTILEPWFKSIAANVDFEAPNIDEVLYSGLLGALSAGGHNAVAGVASAIQHRTDITNQGRSIIDEGGVDSLKQLALEMAGVENGLNAKSIGKIANKVTDAATNKNARNVGKLSDIMGETVSKQNAADIQAELVKSGVSEKVAARIAKSIGNEGMKGLATEMHKLDLADRTRVEEVISNAMIDPASSVNVRAQRLAAAEKGEYSPDAAPKASAQEASPEVLKGDHKVSESGNTVYVNENGEAENVSIKKIVSTEGDVKVELDNGKTVSVKDLELSSDAEAMAFEMVTRMETTPETAQVIFEAVKASNATSVQELFIGVPTAYRYGKINYEAGLKGISIPNAIKRLAFERGRVDATPTTTEAQQAEQKATDAKGVTSQKKGNVIFEGFKYSEDSATDMQKASMAGINVLAKMSSLEIHVYASWVENGKRYAMVGGKKRVAPNGWHEEGTNKIYIDINAGNNGEGMMLYTLGHEVTHHIANWNWDGFKKLGDFLIENFSKNNVPVDILIERKKQTLIKSYKRDGKAVPGDNQLFMEAYEEVVAEAMTSMFTDPKAYEKLAELKKQDKTLWQKLGEAIKKMLDKLKSLLGVYDNAKSGAREADFVAKFSKDVYEQLQDLYLKAFVEADANYQAWVGGRNVADFAAAESTDGKKMFQYRAMEADEETYRDMLTKWGKMSDTQVANLFLTIDKAMDIIKDNLEALDYAWEADIDDRAFSPVKPNSDKLYQVSLDFSTLCRKRILQQMVQAQLQEALNKPLTRDEGIAIRDALIALQEEGRQIEVACALCYVESARMKSPEQIKRFMDNKEAVIKEFFAGKSGGDIKAKIKHAEAAAKEKLHKENPNGIKGKDGVTMLDPRTTPLKELPKKYADEIRAAKKLAKESYKPTAEEQVLIDAAKGMTVSDFTSPEGLENLAKNYPRLFDAYTSYVRNATKSKGIENDTWWRAGDSMQIGDVLIANMNRENGLRSQSWSDFQVVHILDYIAATIELATRNAKEQAYTKVPDYAELMGNTGVMVNLSLIPPPKFNGSLDYDSVEGMDYKRALQLRDKYHATVGTICIGINNAQIKLLLGDITIDYVIPYHKSGMSKAIRKIMHIPTWDQYEEYQSEKNLSRADALKQANKYGVSLLDKSDPNYQKAPIFSEWFDIKEARQIAKMENANPSDKAKQEKYGVMYGGYMAMQNAANNYLKLCAERGLSAKFSHEKADFTTEENYWKLLIDRKMVDNVTGEVIEQQTIKPIFDESEILRILNDELDRYPGVKADQEYAVRKVTEAYLSGSLRGGMSAEAIAKVMKTPVDNVTTTNIIATAKEIKEFDSSKEKIEQNIEDIAKMSSVYDVDKSKLEKTGKRPSDTFAEYFEEWGNQLYSDELGDIAVEKSSIKSEIRHGLTAEKIASIEAIPAVVKEGKVIFSGLKPNSDVQRIVVCAPIKIGNAPYYMGVMLQRDTQTQRLYLHNVAIEKEASEISQADLLTTGADESNEHLFVTSILQNALAVKYQNAQNADSVKRNFLEREIDDISNNDYVKMYHHFGSTKNYDVAGYMLGNGVMLDFSGKHWGDDYSTSRQVDHRDVQEVLDDRGNNGINAMIDMIGNGNIRLMPEVGGINLAVKPNSTQMSQLRGYINHFKGEIVVDIDKVGGDTIHSFEYTRGTSSSKILADIKAYFDEGIVPEQKEKDETDIRQFRYSERDSQGNVLSKEQQEFFKDSKVRWGDSLMPVYHGTHEEFTEFDATKGYEKNRVGGLLWAAKDYEYATGYSYLDDPVVMKGYLNITNMLDIGDIDGYADYDKRLQELADLVKLSPSELEAMTTYDPVKYIYDITSSKGFRDRIVELGYDGVTALESGLQTFGFVDSSQFKNVDNKKPTSNPDIRYQERDPDSISNRSLLANALESAAKEGEERNILRNYKTKLRLIEAEQAKLADVREKAHDLRFKKGRTAEETKTLKSLDFEAKQIATRINSYDRELLKIEAMKPIKAVLNREKQMAYKRAEQKGKEALKKQRERASENYKKLLAEKQESRKNAIESRHKTEMRHKIKKVVGDLDHLLRHGSKERNVKLGLQSAVASALEAVNMDTVAADERIAKLKADLMKAKTPEKIQEISRKIDNIQSQGDRMASRLEELRKAYADIRASDDEGITEYYKHEASIIADKVDSVMTKVGNTPLRNMSLSQLEAVYELYQVVLTTVRGANEAFVEGKIEDLHKNVSDIMTEVSELPALKEERLEVGEKAGKFMWNELIPVTAFDRIGSKTFTRFFWELVRGQNTFANDVKEAKEFSSSVRDKYGYSKWDLDKVHEFKLTDGRTFRVTLKHMMSIYAYSKREQALDHMRVGGFFFNDKETFRKEKGILKVIKSNEEGYSVDELVLGAIKSEMSKEQLLYVDEMQDYLTKMGTKGNEVSRVLWGIDIFKEKVYFPLKSSKDFVFQANQTAQETSLKNDGMTKETKPGASNPIVLEAFDDVWANHINRMSQYHSFVIPIENLNKILNYGTWAGTASVSVSTMLKSRHTAAAVEYLTNFVKDLNGASAMHGASNPLFSLVGRFKKTAVAASLSVVVQQPTAVLRSMAVMDAKYLAHMPALRHLASKWEELQKYAPIAIIKDIGGFDAGAGRQASEWLNNDTRRGIDKVMGKIDDITMAGAAWGDKVGWCTIWESVKREIKATTNLKEGSEEFLKKAGERFTEVIVRTQVYDSTLSRSGYMRSKHESVKMMTSFMGEPTVSINMMLDAFTQAKRKNITKKQAGRIIGAVYASTLAAAVAASLIYALRDDDEDEAYLEKFAESLGGKLVDDLIPLNMLPIIRDINSILDGWDVERTDMAIFKDIKDAFDGLNSENKSVWKKIEDFAGAIGNAFGVPAKNLLRTGREVYNLFENIFDGVNPTWDGIGGALTGKKPDKDKDLYEAIINGDEARLAIFRNSYKDDSAYEAAVRKALRENDPRIKEAAQADFDGDIEEYERIINEIIREGNFDKDDILAAVKSKRNDLEPEDEEDDSPAADKEVSIYTVEHYFTAIKSGKTSLANTAKDDIIKTAVANGKSMEDAESAFYSSFRNHAKKVYAEGGLTRSEAERMLIQYGNREKDDAYWDLKEWDYFKQYGTEDGYSKYNNFYDAVRTGRNLKAVIKEYTSHGVEAKTLASRITTYFKPLYVNMSNSERAKLKGYLLNAYVQLGYSRAEKMKDINDWLKDKD